MTALFIRPDLVWDDMTMYRISGKNFIGPGRSQSNPSIYNVERIKLDGQRGKYRQYGGGYQCGDGICPSFCLALVSHSIGETPCNLGIRKSQVATNFNPSFLSKDCECWFKNIK